MRVINCGSVRTANSGSLMLPEVRAAIDTVVQGIQLASDLKYRQQAIDLKAKLDAADTATKPQIQAQLDAAVKNISNDALKPK